MKRSALVLMGVAALTVLPDARLWAQTKSPWIHIRVEQLRDDSKVHVNLPLPVVQAALAMAPEKIASDGRIHIGRNGRDLSVADLRRIWKELRQSGDAQLVSAEDKDETVSVARQGDSIRIRVEKPSHKETVHVDVPVAVVDALLSGEGSDLNLQGALAELQKLRGDIVRVEEPDSKVRIWIDDRN